MAIEIIGWRYESTDKNPEGPLFLTITDGRGEYSVPLPGVYIPGDDLREEVESAMIAIENLAHNLLKYTDRIRNGPLLKMS